MRICFIWIDKFRNFENFGFNISSFFKFKYSIENNFISYLDGGNLSPNFFGDNIIDVLGIIGKNGAGKSNAVELICKAIKGNKSALNTKFFFIIEEANQFTCYYSNMEDFPSSNIRMKYVEYSGSINPLKVIYFSNVFDERKTDFGKDVSDISINTLSRKKFGPIRKQVSSFEKQIELIQSKYFESLNIDLPDKVQLTSKIWRSRFSSSMEMNIYRDASASVKELNKIFRDRLRDIRPENKFIHLLRYGYFFEQIQDYAKTYWQLGSPSQINMKKLHVFVSDLTHLRTESITEKLLDFLENEIIYTKEEQLSLFETEKEKNAEISKIEKLKHQIRFLHDLKYVPEFLSMEYSIEGVRNNSFEYFIFNYQETKEIDFINEFISLFEYSNVFEINWLGISSGHKAYLNLFASIAHELKYTRQKNLLICIDEGDLYLHPKWQTEFFDKLLFVLPYIYSGDIQLILTSHSPFLLSDLPNQSITILDKEFNGATLDGIHLKTNTFGGNLYDLYSEPFFLGNKRTSDFAYKKIRHLINQIEQENIDTSKKIEYQEFLKIIGDEIIQFRLNKLLNND